MDEILATIRRIIAEDEQPGASASRTAAAAPGVSGRGSADDVLELTDALNEDGSVRRLAPIGSSSHAADRSREPPPPAAPEKPEPDARPEPQLRLAEPSFSPSQRQSVPKDERLVSDATTLAAAAALARLAAAPRAEGAAAPLVGDRPLDDVVQDALRPMLQTWLDENLPQIVERLVKAEIARIAARSGPA